MLHTFSLYGEREVFLASEVGGFATREGGPLCVFLNDLLHKDMEFLDTCIHEALHVIRPELSEKRVARVAGCVSRALWKRGVRRGKFLTGLALWKGVNEGLHRTRPRVAWECSVAFDLSCWLRTMGYDT